jgi:primosomal protein N' (replication factor Y)
VVNRVRNQYIQEIWLKMPRDPKTLEQVKDLLRETRQQLLARRGYSALGVVFDVDPS